MNYPIPGVNVDPTVFFANSSYDLGSFEKPMEATPTLTVDYSGVVPSVNPKFAYFVVDDGSLPNLGIRLVSITGKVMKVNVYDGVSGKDYTVGIVAILDDGSRRTDYLQVVVPGHDGCNCAPLPVNVLDPFMVINGTIFVNDRPRFIVSPTEPQGPNVEDWWYNSADGTLYVYATDGTTTYWHALSAVEVDANIATEKLTVTALNTLSPLSHSFIQGMCTVYVNNQAFTAADADAPFTVYGHTITWNPGMYALVPGAKVSVTYTYDPSVP